MTTLRFTEISTSACHPFTLIGPTLPTTTSSIITGEFDSSVATSATATWDSSAPRPRPAAPGIGGSGTDGAGPGTTESPFRPVYVDTAGGISGGPGFGPSPPGARRGSA